MKLNEIPSLFGISSVYDISPFGTGHINSTYHIKAADGEYILQSINSSVFREPEKVMENTSLISKAFSACGNNDVKIPEFLSAGGHFCTVISGEVWRMYRYIEASEAQADSGFLSGYAFGSFIRITDGLKLQPVIEGYHDLGYYFSRLESYVNNGGINSAEPALIAKVYRLCDMLSDAFGKGLPLRNIHGDAKTDNIIISDKCTIIDLDTAMQGYAALDYGDLIRSVCRKEAPSPELISSVTEGFAKGLSGILTDAEIGSLYYGILRAVGELVIRYLTDYISGEGYFRSKTPEECLTRANELLSQFDMFSAMSSDISRIIHNSFGKGGEYAV